MSEDKSDREEAQKTEVQEILEVGRLARVKLYQRLVDKVTRGIALKPSELTVMRNLEQELKAETSGQGQSAEKPKRVVGTLKQTAEYYGKSVRTLRRWSRAGMPILPGNRYDLDQIDFWLDTRKGVAPAQEQDSKEAQGEPGGAPPAPPASGKDHWEAQNKEWQARQRELDYRKRAGELVEKSEVEQLFVARIVAVKQGLLSLERSLPPELIGCKSEREMAAVIRRSVIALLEEYSRQLPAHIVGQVPL